MNISEQLVHLAELANLDQKIKALNDRLEVVPAAAKKADVEADALKKKLDEAEKKKADADRARRTLDGELVAERAKMKKWEARADNIKGEREHAALASEIGAQRRTLRDLEDKILEQMQALEDADKELSQLQPKHKSAAELAAAEWKKVEGEIAELKGEVGKLSTGRKQILDKLPAPIGKRYQQVADKRQGVGVAVIRGETCSACKRTLPPQMVLMVMKGAVVEACPSCSRFLVHESMTRSQAPDEAVEASSDGAQP